jgi:hypothetical protein
MKTNRRQIKLMAAWHALATGLLSLVPEEDLRELLATVSGHVISAGTRAGSLANRVV